MFLSLSLLLLLPAGLEVLSMVFTDDGASVNESNEWNGIQHGWMNMDTALRLCF